MERYAWKGRIKEGTKEEYIRRHKEIWPEMKAVLKEAGIANYSIWFTENELFGYYECEKGAAFAAEVQAKSPVVARWDAFMKDILIMEKDPATGAQPSWKRSFIWNRCRRKDVFAAKKCRELCCPAVCAFPTGSA